MSRLHAAVKLKGVDIDIGLSHLIPLIWNHDIQTLQSCEEINSDCPVGKRLGFGFAWIQFKDNIDIVKFTKIIFKSRTHRKRFKDIKRQGKNLYFNKGLIPIFEGILEQPL